MQNPLKVYALAQVRRICRHFRVARLHLKSPHWGLALVRLQTGHLAQIPTRLRRQRDPASKIFVQAVNAVQIELEKTRMKTNERNCWNDRCQMAEKHLEIPATRISVLRHLHRTRCHVEAFDL